MKKNYIYIILFVCFIFSMNAQAQESKASTVNKAQENIIEGLSIYPNPVSGDRIFISSKNNLEKEVEIFDVLGKRVLQSTISNKELFIGSIPAGVYIIKIKEGEAAATRKLIVR
ncbi:T9SS type A sorting domain-containing protein [Flavobacterium enshiense]|uniref:T9SS type A sorting domain-containing protein n=1 Tax=Flavobacterium enshiense TaxID=1341165 RepID=UPI00345D5F0F